MSPLRGSICIWVSVCRGSHPCLYYYTPTGVCVAQPSPIGAAYIRQAA